MFRRLIINADDYGLSRGVSRGIREAHLKGIVTSSSAMMNMPGVEDDLRLALRETPRLGLGVHLVLTAEHPTLAADQVSGLVSAGGLFPPLEQFTANREQLALDQVRAEWTAQIEKFIAATGRQPDHLDSHHHASYFTQGLFRIFLDLARQYGCAIRCPFPFLDGSGMPSEVEKAFASFAPLLLDEYTPRKPQLFCADFYDQAATRENLVSILDQLPEGSSELMCHPGHLDQRLEAISSYAIPRQAELEVLISPAARQALADRQIELVNFGGIVS